MLSRLAFVTIIACGAVLSASGHAQTGANAQNGTSGAGTAGKPACASSNGSDVSSSGSTSQPDCTPPVAPTSQGGTNTDTGKTPADRTPVR